jgi:hypothetical protein
VQAAPSFPFVNIQPLKSAPRGFYCYNAASVLSSRKKTFYKMILPIRPNNPANLMKSTLEIARQKYPRALAVKLGQPFGLRAIFEGCRQTWAVLAAAVFIVFCNGHPTYPYMPWLWVGFAIFTSGQLSIRSWRNPLYRHVRWICTMSLGLAVAGACLFFLLHQAKEGKWIALSSLFPLALVLPLFPGFKPIEMPSLGTDESQAINS